MRTKKPLIISNKITWRVKIQFQSHPPVTSLHPKEREVHKKIIISKVCMTIQREHCKVSLLSIK